MAYWHPKATKQLKELEQNIQDEVEEAIKEFEEEGPGYDKIGKVEKKELDIDIFRLKVVSESQEVNHRVLIDEAFGSWVFYGVYHRDDAYKIENLMKILKRDYTE